MPLSNVCQCAIYANYARVSWPIGWMEAHGSELWMPSLPGLPSGPGVSRADGRRATIIDGAEVMSATRAGWLLRWGLIVETPVGRVGFWGHGVAKCFAAVQGAPEIRPGTKRLFWWRGL
jgi:hypothetical protein